MEKRYFQFGMRVTVKIPRGSYTAIFQRYHNSKGTEAVVRHDLLGRMVKVNVLDLTKHHIQPK